MVDPLQDLSGIDPMAALSALADQDVNPEDLLEEMVPEDVPPDSNPDAIMPGQGDPLRIPLDLDQELKLALELCEQCDEYDSAMKDRWDREDEIRDAYAQKVDAQRSGLSLDGAQMVSEMVMSLVDQAFSRINGNFADAKPLIRFDVAESDDVSPDQAQDLSSSAERFFNSYMQNEVDFRHLRPTTLLRSAKVGTGVIRAVWKTEHRKSWQWTPESPVPIPVEEELAFVDAELISNKNVKIWPPHIQNWQRGYQFVGHESPLTPAAWREKIGEYGLDEETAKSIEGQWGSNVNNQMDEAERSGVKGKNLNERDEIRPVVITELWCHMPLPDRFEAERFQVILHRESKRILWIGYNAHHSQKHPYFPIRYKWSDAFAWGSGVGDECLQNWGTDTALQNLDLDNLMAGAYHIIKRKTGSGYNTNDGPLRPGSEIYLDNPAEDFLVQKMGGEATEIGSSRDDNYNRARMAVGLSSVSAGIGDPVMKSGAGTGSTQALIEQGSIKLGQIDRNLREDLSDLFMHCFELVCQYGQRGLLTRAVSQEDAQKLQMIFYTPPRGDVSRTFRIRVEAPSADMTNEARKQAGMVLWNFAMQHCQAVNQMLTPLLQMQNPAAIPRWTESLVAFLNSIAKRVVDWNDLPGVDKMVPELPTPTPQDQIINQLNQQLQQAQMQLQQMQQEAMQMMGQPMEQQPQEQAVAPY